jgi:5'-nucleotidase/UDP-sugar diphosphatase
MPQYAIYNVGDIKVGVFGVMTPETYYKSSPVNTEGLDITDPYEAGKKMSEFLRPHVDVVVALSHLGVDGGSEFVSTGLAEAAPEIDVIFDGHSHTLMEEPVIVGNTLIIQGGEHGRNISQVKVTLKLGESATDRMTIVSKEGSLVTYEALMETEPDADVLDMTTKIQAMMDEVASEIIGKTAVDLDGERETNRSQESNLGDLIAEAMLVETGADVALTNGGGIRASIPAGDITLGQVITTFPFGNYIVTIEATGQDLIDAMENGLSDYPELKGAFPQIAGMTVTFDPKQPAGSRVVELKVGGQPVDPAATYVLATNNFLAVGGDQYTMFADNPLLGEFSAFDEVLAKYLQTHGTDDLKVDGRITPIE